MRKEYEMTKKELKDLKEASKPVRYMVFGGIPPTSPQENANMVWAKLGKKYGFRPMTVRPVQGKSQRFFTAEASDE